MKKFSGFNKGLVYALVTSMVISCAAGIGPLRANAATTGTVNADALNVRSGAGTGYSRVGTVTQGQTLGIVETVQGSDGYTWYRCPERFRDMLGVTLFRILFQIRRRVQAVRPERSQPIG